MEATPSVKANGSPPRVCQKAPEGLFDQVKKKKISGLMRRFKSGINARRHVLRVPGTAHILPNTMLRENHVWWQHYACGDVFQQQEPGDNSGFRER